MPSSHTDTAKRQSHYTQLEHEQHVAAERHEITKTIAEVAIIDPELLEYEDARRLIELGAKIGAHVTRDFGSPDNPKWAVGTFETKPVFMTYHNGGPDGHTSIGQKGAGVARNALLLAAAVNKEAGRDVYDPLMRSEGFCGSMAHDSRQLCGRALIRDENGGAGPHGDEILSANDVRDQYLTAGGEPDTAARLHNGVLATAFNPRTGAQNVRYEAWDADPDDPELTKDILMQELLAAADLLGPTSRRGPLGAVEYAIEAMCLHQKNQIIQRRLAAYNLDPAQDVVDVEHMLDILHADEQLRTTFADTLEGQSKFFGEYLQYSDKAIRKVCGKGVAELFPGLKENSIILAEYVNMLRDGTATPKNIYHLARAHAGYGD